MTPMYRLFRLITKISFAGPLCNRPMGMQSGRIKNNRIIASSEMNAAHAAWLGRLNRARRGAYRGAWCSKHNNHNQWFKVDFGRAMKITKVATQGQQDYSQWVTRYMVSSSFDGVHWSAYRYKNSDRASIVLCLLYMSIYSRTVYYLLYVYMLLYCELSIVFDYLLLYCVLSIVCLFTIVLYTVYCISIYYCTVYCLLYVYLLLYCILSIVFLFTIVLCTVHCICL